MSFVGWQVELIFCTIRPIHMEKKMKKHLYLLPLLFVLFACGAQPQPTQDVSAIVNATLTAIAVQPDPQLVVRPTDPNATPGRDYFPPMGTITGSLSYPSSFIPSMRVAFFNLTDGSVSYTDTGMNQGTYSIDLPEGTYNIVAYPYDAASYTPPAPGAPALAGGYTQAVPCGLLADCTDHSLIPVTVVAGQTITADPGDWYAPAGTFPSMPAP
jgi:hypothetical protein